MRLGPSYALWGACLILASSGCASPARQAGLATGVGNAPVRLMRPADPIARLSPAKVSVGPLYDPGSYTSAGVPDPMQPGPGVGPLSVGGGQLADQGASRGRGQNQLAARGASARTSASPGQAPEARPATQLAQNPVARTASPRPEPEPEPKPEPEMTPDGWPIVPSAPQGSLVQLGIEQEGLRSPSDSRDPRPDSENVSRSNRDLGAGLEADLALDREPRSGQAPILAAGIDLETYAAPPVATDPNARLASTRRPVAALLDARAAVRAGPSENRPEPVAESVGEQGESAIPELTDLPRPEDIPPDPESDDSSPELEPIPPARDDVRPTAIRPSFAEGERSAPRQAIETPTPFEQPRLVERLGNRVQRIRDRLTPDRNPFDRSSASESSAARGRLLRVPRLQGAEDAQWLMPGGGSPGMDASGMNRP